MMRRLAAALTLALATTSAAFAQMPAPQAPVAPSADPPRPYAAKAASGEETTSGEYRVLGGHRFVTPGNIESAFLNTSVASAQGVGILSYRGTSALDGTMRDAQVFLYTQTVLATVGIANRLALDLRAAGVAAVGGDLDTILTVGALATLNAGAMAKLRLFTLEDVGFQATAGVGGYYTRTLNLQPAILIGKALGDARALEADVIQQTSSFELVPALMLAEGVGAFGVQAAVSPKIRTATGQTNAVDVGGQVTLDVGKVTSYVPIALSGEYQVSVPIGGAGNDHHLGASVLYSGRQAFNVGVLGGVHLFASDMKIITGGIAMQYFF